MRPTEKLSEVQKVLQDRILSRQRMKQQLQQNQKDIHPSIVNANTSEMVESNLLQNMIFKQSEEKTSMRNVSTESSVRKRVRKPGKILLSFKN